MRAEICPTCSGIWLDPGNLRSTFTSPLEGHTDDLERASAEDAILSCPVDPEHTLLRKGFFGIQIDTCPNQHGVWFDAGELEALVPKWQKAIANSAFKVDKAGNIRRETDPDLLMKLIVGREEQNLEEWAKDVAKNSTQLGPGLRFLRDRVLKLFVWHAKEIPKQVADDLNPFGE